MKVDVVQFNVKLMNMFNATMYRNIVNNNCAENQFIWRIITIEWSDKRSFILSGDRYNVIIMLNVSG